MSNGNSQAEKGREVSKRKGKRGKKDKVESASSYPVQREATAEFEHGHTRITIPGKSKRGLSRDAR